MTARQDLELVVFSLRTTVRALGDSLREADQSFSAKRLIEGSVSESGTSSSNVSSTEMDCVGRSGITAASSIPRAISLCSIQIAVLLAHFQAILRRRIIPSPVWAAPILTVMFQMGTYGEKGYGLNVK